MSISPKAIPIVPDIPMTSTVNLEVSGLDGHVTFFNSPITSLTKLPIEPPEPPREAAG